jgi:hypothetical protein
VNRANHNDFVDQPVRTDLGLEFDVALNACPGGEVWINRLDNMESRGRLDRAPDDERRTRSGRLFQRRRQRRRRDRLLEHGTSGDAATDASRYSPSRGTHRVHKRAEQRLVEWLSNEDVRAMLRRGDGLFRQPAL